MNDANSFDPEAACRQVAEFRRALFRQFMPCFIPCAFVALVGCAICQFIKSPIYLIGIPLVAVYLVWLTLVLRRNQEASIVARQNMRLLRRDYPHLARKACELWPWKSRIGVFLAVYIGVCVAVPMAILAVIATRP